MLSLLRDERGDAHQAASCLGRARRRAPTSDGSCDAGSCILAAGASAPQVKTQAPGFYRMMLGDFEVTALSDGTFDLDTSQMLTHVPCQGLAPRLARSFAGNIVPISVNAYLINTGDRLILADTGAADLFGPTLGRLASNLLASGYRPEQVDAVILTHMHPDHVGGLLLEGRRAFPNATVYAEHKEADFWLAEAAHGLARAPSGSRPSSAPKSRRARRRGTGSYARPNTLLDRVEREPTRHLG